MKFCSACAQPLILSVPPGDNRTRAVCTGCGTIYYENPRVVVGCVPEWHGQVLLCRRAIEPRRGYWTTPSGYFELGETLQAAAARESLEEAESRVEIGSLLAVTHVLHAAQVHMTFRARMLDERFAAGPESLQVGLYAEAQIPWDLLAFPSINFALCCYFEDRRAARESLHFHTIDRSHAIERPRSRL